MLYSENFLNMSAKKNLSPDDILSLLDYSKFFELLKLPLPSNSDGIINKMIQEKIITKNGHGYIIKNIGALLFAKDLNNFDNISRKAVRVILYDGDNRLKTIKEMEGRRGYAVGFEGLIEYIDNILPSVEEISTALRGTIREYPIIAVRELVANALIHQDFSISGTSPMIEIFENRIEITNPGKPLIDPLRFVDHNPESRNEILTRFMRRLNICEERGSGFDKVILECEFNQLPSPKIIIDDRYTRVILYGQKSFAKMDKMDKIRACYLHSCIKYVSGDFATNQSLRQRFHIETHNYTMASRIISETIKEGLLKEYLADNKSKKFAKYIPFWA